MPAPEDGAIQASIQAIDVGDGDVVDRPVLLVGDSVLVSIADDLAGVADAALHVDAVDCRTLAEELDGGCGGVPAGATIDSGLDAVEGAIDLVAPTEGAGRAGVAVLVLANNATFSPEDLDAAMAATGGAHRVWWVNARIEGFGRQDINNGLLEDLAARDPRAGVIDWFGASEGHDDWFTDHVHPNDEGQARLAELIADHLSCDCVP